MRTGLMGYEETRHPPVFGKEFLSHGETMCFFLAGADGGSMFKKFLSLLLVLLLSLSIVGCTSEVAEEAPPEPAVEDTAPEPALSPETPEIILATTTSTQDSGLLDALIPIFEEETGYMVKTIAVGTGAALAMGENGEADVLMTHAPASEQVLVDAGNVIDYTLLMHNDFVFVGPTDDPAGLTDIAEASAGLAAIQDTQSLFISRGDDSGTHKMELSLWMDAGIEPSGAWYQESGSGMGDTLNIAAEKNGYTLTDRATYLNLQNNLTTLAILLEKDPVLNNIYHVMAVNPAQFEKVNYEGASAWIAFLVRDDIQDFIGEFGVEEFGQPLFFPDAE